MEYNEYLDLVKKLLKGNLPPSIKEELLAMPSSSQLRNIAIDNTDKDTNKILQIFTLEEITKAVSLNLRIFGYLSDVFLFLALYEHFKKGEKLSSYLKNSLYDKRYPYYLWFERIAENSTTWGNVLVTLLKSEHKDLLEKFLREILQSEDTTSILHELNFDSKALSGLIEALITLPELYNLKIITENINPELAAGTSLNVLKLCPYLLPTAVRVLTPERLIKSTTTESLRMTNIIENLLTNMAAIKFSTLPEEIHRNLGNYFKNLIDTLSHKYKNRTLNPVILLYLTKALINSEIQIESKKINYIVKHFIKIKEDKIQHLLHSCISLRSTPLKIKENIMIQLRPKYIYKLVSLSICLYKCLKTNWIVMDLTTPKVKGYMKKKVLSSKEINKNILLDQIELYLYLFRHENLNTRITRFLEINSLKLPHPEYIFKKIIENPNIDNIEKAELIYFFSKCLMKQELLDKPATTEKIYRVENILAKALKEDIIVSEKELEWQKFLSELTTEKQKNNTPRTCPVSKNKLQQISLF